MTPDELRRDEARRWLVLAGRDLNSARLLTGRACQLRIPQPASGRKGRQGFSRVS